MESSQECVDRFYREHGPCCAGCDFWRHLNAAVGECIRGAPVVASERYAMFGIVGCSLEPGAGHIMTPRDHLCGEFRDEA